MPYWGLIFFMKIGKKNGLDFRWFYFWPGPFYWDNLLLINSSNFVVCLCELPNLDWQKKRGKKSNSSGAVLAGNTNANELAKFPHIWFHHNCKDKFLLFQILVNQLMTKKYSQCGDSNRNNNESHRKLTFKKYNSQKKNAWNMFRMEMGYRISMPFVWTNVF